MSPLSFVPSMSWFIYIKEIRERKINCILFFVREQ